MDPRTLRAAVVAALIGAGSVAFFGLFLGFQTTPTLVTALVVGLLAGVLIAGASRRAETFESPDDPPPAA